MPDYQKVEAPKLFYGRFINNMDMSQRRKVCVLGKKVYKTLFRRRRSKWTDDTSGLYLLQRNGGS